MEPDARRIQLSLCNGSRRKAALRHWRRRKAADFDIPVCPGSPVENAWRRVQDSLLQSVIAYVTAQSLYIAVHAVSQNIGGKTDRIGESASGGFKPDHAP